MSVLRVILLLLLNLALYAFLVARLLGWRPPGWRAENLRQRVLSVGLAVALTAAVVLAGMTLLTSGLVSESGSVRILRSALWVDAGIILLLLVLWGLPRLPWPALRSAGARQRVLALVLAVALTAGVALMAVALLGSGLLNQRLLRSALWLDGALILLLLVLWGLPWLPWAALRSEGARQQALSVALALALTAAAALGGIALVASGAVSGAGSPRLLRIALSVDAGMALLLLALWIFPRLPWPVYARTSVRARAEWRQALGGLAAAALIVATIAGGFILAYGEIGALDQPEAVETPAPKVPTLAVAAVVATDIPATPSSNLTEPAATPTAIPLPTRGGTEIPTVTPTARSTTAPIKTVVSAPTATAPPAPTATAQPTATPPPAPTATEHPTATAVPTPTACVPGASGWVEYTVQIGDTLSGLAQQAGTQGGAVLQANCLTDDQLDVGQRILLPFMELVADGALLASQKIAPPVIDGDMSEWGALENTADAVVYGMGNWSGAGDLSATFSLGWDAANLYLAVSVRDDVHAQTQNGESIFRGDSVEFLFDGALQADRQHEKLSGDDYQIGLSPGDLSAATVVAQAYCWFPVGQAGSMPAAQLAASASVDGYVLEAAVPWAALGVAPASGDEYGFALSVSDNDLPGVAAQQSMVSSATARSLTDPTTWGRLRLDP
ncbi:MAG: sugar-binding protein [Anaerolineales bacterium]|jgi:LysM repeat protein|nr:sugar-binding protein [Anaerolineales bacterium]HJN41537.1 sugar-binding protein [Anaerolineales bacterium]